MTKTVSQIDLVPTLSLLLNVPIPFSNIGAVIPDLLLIGTSQDAAKVNLMKALHTNYRQVSKYLESYSEVSRDLPLDIMARLSSMETSLNRGHTTEQRIERHYAYLQTARRMCQDIWAKFDMTMMLVGILHTLFSLLFRAAINLGVISKESLAVNFCQVMMTLLSLQLGYLAVSWIYCLIIMTFSFLLAIIYCSSLKKPQYQLTFIDIACVLIILLQFFSSFSNSMIVHDDTATMFLAQSTVWLLSVKLVNRSNDGSRSDKLRTPRYPFLKSYLKECLPMAVVLSVIVSIARMFAACREEQNDCEPPLALTALSALKPEESFYKNIRFWCMSVPAVAIICAFTHIVLKVRGNLNGTASIVLMAFYVLPAVAAMLGLHWAVSAAPASERLPEWMQVFLPRTVYILVLCITITAIIRPLAIFYHTPQVQPSPPQARSVPALYQFMKQSLYSDEKPLVYGLSNVFSASYLILLTTLSLLFMMLGGDGMAIVQLLLLFSMLIFLDMAKSATDHQTMHSGSF